MAYRGPPMGQPGGFPPQSYGQAANPLQTELEKKQWSEHRRPDGRAYWYNSTTKQSVWSKPAVLKTHEEKLLDSCPWKEHTHPDTGRKYYYNSRTKVSEWVKPKELEEFERILGKAPAKMEAAPAATVAPVATTAPVQNSAAPPALATGASTSSTLSTPRVAAAPSDQSIAGGVNAAPKAQTEQPAPETTANTKDTPSDGLMYATKEEAREAFKQMLTDEKVSADWAWDKVKRAIALKPRWNALKREGEKKQAWRAWVPQRARIEKEERLKQARETRNALKDVILMVDEIGLHTTYRQAAELLRTHYAFKNLKIDRDRQEVFKDAIHEKEKAIKAAEKAEHRKRANAIRDAIKQLDPPVTLRTKWEDAQKQILKAIDVSDNPVLKDVHNVDILNSFRDHRKDLDRDLDDKVREEKGQLRRILRQARDGFDSLLEELKLSASSLWKEHYTKIAADDRYQTLLNLATNSKENFTPLDLFKLKIERLKDELHDQMKTLKSIMRDVDFSMTPETTLEQFHTALCSDSRYVSIPSDSLRLAHKHFADEAVAREQQRKEREEYRARRRIERFTSMLESGLRKFEKGQSWEDVSQIFDSKPDFIDITDPDERRKLFEEFVSTDPWENMKKRGRSSTPSRSRSRSGSRDRDGHRNRKSRRRSRSPSVSDSDDGYSERRHKHKKHKKEKKAKKEKKHKKDKSRRRSDDDHRDDDDIDDNLERKRLQLLNELKASN